MEKCIFIGVVTEIVDNHNFIFHVNSNYKCQLQQVVGLNITENTFVLANITNIDIGYFLKDKEEYFTSLSVDNKLQELSSGVRKPKMATKIKATYLGIYKYDKTQNKFFESEASIDTYTPSVFQEVFTFDLNSIETVYGLIQNTETSFKIGKFLYPNYNNNDILPDVNISAETFNSHTLISGVTGSGKSRLTALIANKLASHGGHITIIDPHDEYVKLACTKNVEVSFISKNPRLHEDRDDINKRNLSFSNTCLVPQIISKLLPELSEQQMDYLYEVFEKNTLSKSLSVKTITETIIEDFNSEFIAEGLNVIVELKEKFKENGRVVEKIRRADKMTLAQEYAEKDQKNDFTFKSRYVSCFEKELNIRKIVKLHVIFAVLKKILTIYETGLFPIYSNSPIPSWLDIDNRRSINIMNFTYDSNSNVRRFVNAIIQCFFTPQTNNRTLIVDEAHLLLNDKLNETLNKKTDSSNDTAVILNRLLRESRKYGLSIIFITQNEADVPEEIKSQFQNRFKFRERNNTELKYLDNQTCMCSLYKGKLHFSMRVDNVGEIK